MFRGLSAGVLRAVISVGVLGVLSACVDDSPLIDPTGIRATTVAPTRLVTGDPTPNGPYEEIRLSSAAGDAMDINTQGQVLFNEGERAWMWHRGVSVNLGTLPGGTRVVGSDINENGQVVGAARAADGTWRQFLWADGVMQDLGPRNLPFSGGGFGNVFPRSFAPQAINNRGDVIWSVGFPGPQRSFFWRDGVAQDIGTLGGDWAIAAAVNDAGLVAGTSMVPGDNRPHLFLWENGVMRDVFTSPGTNLDVRHMNENGHVLMSAYYGPGNEFAQHMLLWDGTEVREIKLGSNSVPAWVNNRMQVAATTGGVVAFDLGRPYFWDGSPRLIGQANGFTAGWAIALNDSGTVTGYLGSAGFRPTVVVWEGDSTWQLQISQSRFDNSQPIAINNWSDVVGYHNGATLWRRMINVAVDIKPGSDENPINQNGGNTPVAILSSATFDATTVDPTTVEFAGGPSENHSVEDVNGDGRPDVVHKFASNTLVLGDSATQACVRAETVQGRPLKGCDVIRLKQ